MLGKAFISMGLRIWLINHYAVPEIYYPLLRTANFAKYLMRLGHEVTVFSASAVHNSTVNLIQDGALFREETVKDVHYVYVRCRSYTGNGAGRIGNMFEFAFRLPDVCGNFPTPDVIMASSATPLACMAGLRLAKKYGVKGIAEITDLWPESFIAYGLIKKSNPLLFPMYWFERKMYEEADEIIFSMAGGYDYIRERGWENIIPQGKVHLINNGVDLEVFDYNREQYSVDDEDLQNDAIFKVIYVGSIRRVNNLGKLLAVAKQIKNPKIKFLIWGKGDELSAFKQRVNDEKICNVVFKGYVEKKYVPYIVSHADLNIVHSEASPIWRFGPSLNKMFDCLAAGKPILTDFPCKYNPVAECMAGVEVSDAAPQNIAVEIERFAALDKAQYVQYCKNARKGAKKYDAKTLTQEVLTIMEKQ